MIKRFETLLIATRNPAKENRYRDFLTKYANRVIGLKDVVTTGKPDEDGETAEENAEIKVRFYAKQTGYEVFAEDEALFVDFLPQENQPGVHVRRINGKNEANDEQLLVYWGKIVANAPPGERKGKWHIAYCIARSDGTVKTFSLDFPILFFSPSSPIRIAGWPLSSLEGPTAFNKPYSEFTEEERHQADQRRDQAIAKITEEILI